MWPLRWRRPSWRKVTSWFWFGGGFWAVILWWFIVKESIRNPLYKCFFNCSFRNLEITLPWFTRTPTTWQDGVKFSLSFVLMNDLYPDNSRGKSFTAGRLKMFSVITLHWWPVADGQSPAPTDIVKNTSCCNYRVLTGAVVCKNVFCAHWSRCKRRLWISLCS